MSSLWLLAARSAVVAIRRCPQQPRSAVPLCMSVTAPFFSTNTKQQQQQQSDDADTDDDTAHIRHQHKQQPFVKTRFDPGEWDAARKNPLYRPKFQSTAKILHADDFARRPKVGYTGEFENFHDAMVTLSYLGQTEQRRIYDAYLNLMLSAEAGDNVGGRTSHEYVYKVLAKQFHMTVERIAGIVLLQHNEERYKCSEATAAPLLSNAEVQQIDDKFRNEIAEAYACTGERPPLEFTEDPVGSDGTRPPANTQKYTHAAGDLLDLAKMTADWTVREGRRGRLILDGHVYKEDQYDEDVQLPLSKAAKQLLRQKERLAKALANDPIVEEQRRKGAAIEPEWRTVGASKGKNGQRRPRWRYVAQIVDTRQPRQIRGKKYRAAFVNNSLKNTIVEHDGELRPGTLADVKTVAWKPQHDALEALIAPVRKAWLDRTVGGNTLAWGKAPEHLLAGQAVAQIEAAAAAEEEDVEGAAVEAAAEGEDDVENDQETEEETSASGDDAKEEASESSSSDDDVTPDDEEEPKKEEGTEDDGDSKK